MNKRSAIFALLALAVVAAGIWGAHRFAFDWVSLRLQLRHVSLTHVFLGVACIYAGFWLRAARWAILMGPSPDTPAPRPSLNSLVAPQFIGFTAVALFGRLADLARPYLIARRTGRSVASQIAVYSVERIFDLAAAAILFSVTLAFAPRDLPHHEAFARAGMISLAATVTLAAGALVIRFAGERLAAAIANLPLPRKFAPALAARILDFRAGLYTLRTLRDFAATLALSLVTWLGIAEAYVQSAHAMTLTPQLANLTFTQTMLLMATSLGGSLLQLPVLGWFTQIALLAAALHAFFNAPTEAATACSTVVLFILTLSIIPAGLIATRLTGTTLRDAAKAGGADESTPPPA